MRRDNSDATILTLPATVLVPEVLLFWLLPLEVVLVRVVLEELYPVLVFVIVVLLCLLLLLLLLLDVVFPLILLFPPVFELLLEAELLLLLLLPEDDLPVLVLV